jgi:hypothetical protein
LPNERLNQDSEAFSDRQPRFASNLTGKKNAPAADWPSVPVADISGEFAMIPAKNADERQMDWCQGSFGHVLPGGDRGSLILSRQSFFDASIQFFINSSY